MKNLTTEEFCRKFGACTDGMRFALKFKTMRECYAALLAGDAGDKSVEFAIWTVSRVGVMSDRDLRLFAVRCARRVQHLMKYQRSIDALDVAERYAKGEATDEELAAARADARDDARDDAREYARAAARAAAWAAARESARAAAWAAARESARADARESDRDAERREQLKILAEFGNPFGEDNDGKVD